MGRVHVDSNSMALLERFKLYSRLQNSQACPITSSAVREILTFWDPKARISHVFYNDDGWFLSGFWDFVVNGLRIRGIRCETFEAPEFPIQKIPTEGCRGKKEVWGALKELQRWAAGHMTATLGGLVKLPTRFGKTYMIAGVYRGQYNPTTLVVVPTTTILHQAVKEITEFLNEQVGCIGDGILDIKRLTFATAQSIVEAGAGDGWPNVREKLIPYLESVQTIAWDEIHQHGKMFVSINEACKNAIFRHGYSATPFTGKTWWDASAIGFLGPLICDVPAKDLADRGDIEHAAGFFWRFHNPPEGDPKDWPVFYKDNIVRNAKRNELIASIANDYISQGKNVLVFAEQVEHLRKLHKLIPGSEMLAAKLTDQYRRKDQIKEDFNKGKIKCVIVTKVWRMGVTLYADAGINAGGQKQGELGQNEIQMLGRGLMPKGAVFHWNDIVDDANYQFRAGTLGEHSFNRMKAVLNEDWPVHIINTDYTAVQVHTIEEARAIILPDSNKEAR